MKMNKKILFLILLLAVLVFPIAVYADKACDAVKNIRDASLKIGGSIVAIGWIIAGILYLTAVGGPRMETAKKALIAAVIGTVLVIVSAFAIGIVADLLKFGGDTTTMCT